MGGIIFTLKFEFFLFQLKVTVWRIDYKMNLIFTMLRHLRISLKIIFLCFSLWQILSGERKFLLGFWALSIFFSPLKKNIINRCLKSGHTHREKNRLGNSFNCWKLNLMCILTRIHRGLNYCANSMTFVCATIWVPNGMNYWSTFRVLFQVL